ncbi:MAG TPA: hypothetical protein VGO71_21350 [Baekduia sp.]|jgi:hypothetical protein|nr:hypothetical protein [Baekduia sp.]
MLTRGGFLRAGAVAGAAGVGGLLPVTAARARLPAPTPVADDAAFLQFTVIAERGSLAYYRRIGSKAAARQKAEHVRRLTAALGADAPATDDFAIALPARAFATPTATIALGMRLEALLVGVLLSGVTSTVDGATRLLLGRLLANDAQHLADLRHAAGQPAAQGLAVPLELEAAGTELDRLLKTTNYPTA